MLDVILLSPIMYNFFLKQKVTGEGAFRDVLHKVDDIEFPHELMFDFKSK